MGTMFIAGQLPKLTDSQKEISRAAWRTKDNRAKDKLGGEVITVYASPEYLKELEEKAAAAAAEKAARKAAGIAKRQATLAKKRKNKGK